MLIDEHALGVAGDRARHDIEAAFPGSAVLFTGLDPAPLVAKRQRVYWSKLEDTDTLIQLIRYVASPPPAHAAARRPTQPTQAQSAAATPLSDRPRPTIARGAHEGCGGGRVALDRLDEVLVVRCR